MRLTSICVRILSALALSSCLAGCANQRAATAPPPQDEKYSISEAFQTEAANALGYACDSGAVDPSILVGARVTKDRVTPATNGFVSDFDHMFQVSPDQNEWRLQTWNSFPHDQRALVALFYTEPDPQGGLAARGVTDVFVAKVGGEWVAMEAEEHLGEVRWK